MKVSAITRRNVLSVLLAGTFVWLVCAIFHPFEPRYPEPQYQGKKLTDWAEEVDQSDFFEQAAFQQHQKRNEQAISAIRHIGTNALPVAVKLCGAKDSWFKRQWWERVERYNDNNWPKRFPIRVTSAWEKNFEGDNIIWALGPMAEPAIPDLIQLLQSRDKETAESAMTALPGVGTNAIPPLLKLLTNASLMVRLRAAFVLQISSGQKRLLLLADHWSWLEAIILGWKPVPLFLCCFNALKIRNWIKLRLSAPFIPLA